MRLRLSPVVAVLVVSAAVCSASRVFADPGEVVLKNGDVLRGQVRRTADAVVVEHATLGRVTLDPAQVAEVREAAAPATRQAWQAFERPTERDAAAVVATLCGGADPCAPAAPAPCARCWKLKGGLAASLTAGNSDSLALVANAEYTRESGRWKWLLGGSFIYNQSDGDVTAERWYGIARAQYALTGRSYVFGQVTFDRDEPADLEYRLTAVGGYGHYFVQTDRHDFRGEVGGGLTWEKFVDEDETLAPTAYVALHYLRKWTDKREFQADLSFFPNLDDFDRSYGRLFLGYRLPLTELLRITVGARFDYVVAPPEGVDELDVFLTVGFAFEV